MANQLFANNATTTTRGFTSTSATTITVNSSAGFPNPTNGNWFIATFDGGGNSFEVVKVTAVVGNTWTIVRAQEGTVAQLWQPNSRIECRVTKGTLEYLLSVSPLITATSYGAIGDGTTDNRASIQAAIDYLNSIGGGFVVFPPGIYRFNNNINLKSGVGFFGIGGKLLRGFPLAVNGVAISCAGNNVIWNMQHDGNSPNITVTGTQYTLYQEYLTDTATAPVTFWNCKFDNACGSFIVGSSVGGKVEECRFGEYLDHCVYNGNRQNVSANCADWYIAGNSVNAPTATREPFKVRNGISGYKLVNNYVNAPNAFAFLDLTIGDDTNTPKTITDVFVDGNTGICNSAISMQNGGLAGSPTTVAFDNIVFGSGNNFQCSSYSLRLGNFPTTIQNGITAKSLVFRGKYTTTFASSGIINGDMTSMLDDLLIDADLTHNGELGLFFLGNVNKLTIKGSMKSTNNAFNGKVLESPIPYSYSAYKPTVVGLVTMSGLRTDGYISYMLREQTFGGSATSGMVFNTVIENCKMTGPLTKQPINIAGAMLAAATGQMVARANDLYGTTAASVGNPGHLVEENFNQKVVISPNGTKYKVTVDNTGVISTAVV